MYSRETRVLLRHYLEQGVSKTELAKRFGISRRTVYHWIETGQLDRDFVWLRSASIIWINQLRWTVTQPRVAQPQR